jgi:Tfp pilus assembly protein PilV
MATTRTAWGERGSVLVEALVATALLGVALISLTATLSALAVAGRTAENQATAQAAARAQIDRIKAGPYDWKGKYDCCKDPLPAGFTRNITAEWWNGTDGWDTWLNLGCQDPPPATGDPCQIGAQRITVRYCSPAQNCSDDKTDCSAEVSMACFQFVKVDR